MALCGWGMPPTRLNPYSGHRVLLAMLPKFSKCKIRTWTMMRKNFPISSPTEDEIHISRRAVERVMGKYFHIFNSSAALRAGCSRGPGRKPLARPQLRAEARGGPQLHRNEGGRKP
jgi:hypothetical protein